ncbi:30S ribosomal protein S1 [Candidatus Dependentiae bacterium]|nr:MAG: 30S ribosomal protein S1 [Candidatus Dependentiae bacterium]
MSKEVIKPAQFGKANAKVIEEEALQLNEEQLQELNQLYEAIVGGYKQGNLVKGKIVRIDSEGVLIDINYKSDGLISSYEFAGRELKKLKPGDELEVLIEELESIDGTIVLSYEKAKALKAWDSIMKLYEEDSPVEGTVTHKVKGGLSVDIGIPAFLPGSQIDLHKVLDFDQYIGKPITAYIIKVNKKRGNVIISCRKYLAEQRAETRKKALETLVEGQVIQGIVKNITNYGVFIDIGGVDGLLHITDMTWGRISHPGEMVRIGNTIAVKVLSFDKDNEKISLGFKQLHDNPWEKIAEKLKPGERVKGIISSITDYGLFVEIEKGVEGLVHISEISWIDRINDLKSKFKPGQEVEVYVSSLDKENRRMSLSIKQLEKNPWESISEKFSVGQRIKGPITNITDFGVFIEVDPGVDGLAHISDLSWTEHIDHPSDIYKRGDEVEAVVLNIDPANKKISLGIKQITPDPWENIEQECPVGKIVEGTVSKITNFGGFVKFSSGIEGLVHISELGENVDKVEDVLKLSETKKFRVINVSKDLRKLGLSLNLEPKKEQEKSNGQEIKTEKKVSKIRKESKPTMPSKPKSILQLALEQHVARQKEEVKKTQTKKSVEKKDETSGQ